MKMVIATKNRGKAREIADILKGLPIEIVTLEESPAIVLPPETGETFRENARAKARAVAEVTGLPALADDSGLEVDALEGRPGVRSARYAGENATDRENYELLLRELKGVPLHERGGRFRCALAYAELEGIDEIFEGSFEGVIAESPEGEGGFGYDPVFIVPEKGVTVAELGPGEKDKISHRAKALFLFREFLIARQKKKS